MHASSRIDRKVLINTSALAGSSLWRIGLSFILQLLIANRLGAEGLGQYTIALTYLNVCQVLSELGLPQLLVRDLARFPGRRRRYFGVALLLQVGMACFVWIALAGLTFLLPFQPATRTALVMITASLPFFAISSVCTTLFQAGERMELVMGGEMILNALITGSSILVLLNGGTVVHLAGVVIFTQAFSVLLYLFLLHRAGLLTGGAAPAMHRSWLIVARLLWHKARPFFGLSLANVLLHRLDILLLSAVVGEVVTGIYSAAYLVVRVFLILSQTYWQALYPTLSRLRQRTVHQYWRLAALGIRYGLMVFLPAAAVGSGVADPLLGLIFRGESYEQSVPVFQVLIWIIPLFLTATFAVNLLLVERKPQYSLWVALVHLLMILLLLPPLATRFQALGAAVAVLAAIAAGAAAGLLLLRRVDIPIDLPFRWPLLLLVTFVVAATVRLLPLVSPAVLWPVHILVSLGIYLLVVWYSKILSLDDLWLFRRALQR